MQLSAPPDCNDVVQGGQYKHLRDRATGPGSEKACACDVSYAEEADQSTAAGSRSLAHTSMSPGCTPGVALSTNGSTLFSSRTSKRSLPPLCRITSPRHHEDFLRRRSGIHHKWQRGAPAARVAYSEKKAQSEERPRIRQPRRPAARFRV